MYRLSVKGKIQPKSALEMKSSRLGIGLEKLDRAVFDPSKIYDKLGELGVKWIRLQSGWQRTETEKGIYHFEWLDEIVDNLIARGMTPWMCVCYGNQLYDEKAKRRFGAVGCMPIHTEEQKSAWSDYCRALAAHYKGRVKHFEVWNEPDGDWNIETAETATDVGLFNIATAKALKEGNSEAYVIGGSLCATVVRFLNEALQTGMGDYVDAISFHEYTYAEELVSQKVNAIRGLCNFYAPGLEIIQGESGSQSRSGGHGALKEAAWTERKQCKQLLRHLVKDLLCGVKFTSYFTSVDMIEALNGKVGDVASYLDYGYFGVFGAEFDGNGRSVGEYRKKQSFYVLQNLASILHGDLSETVLPVVFLSGRAPHTGFTPNITCAEASYGGFRLDNGSLALAYWYPANLMTTEFEGAVSLEIAASGREPERHSEISLIDPMDGTVYGIPSEIVHADGRGGYVFEDLPIKDYPMFLVFGKIE